jgi:hypothetical protein
VARERLLGWATALYAVGLVAHTADHVRRGTDVTTSQVEALGAVSTIGGVLVIALVVARHRLAPLAAVLFGIPTALGVSAVHLLPRWSDFSDAFPGADGSGVTALSWTVVLVEIVGALAVGLAGLAVLRSQSASGTPESHTAPSARWSA